jgi:hypothetical protein
MLTSLRRRSIRPSQHVVVVLGRPIRDLIVANNYLEAEVYKLMQAVSHALFVEDSRLIVADESVTPDDRGRD